MEDNRMRDDDIGSDDVLYRDLRGFLVSSRADVRLEATRAVLHIMLDAANDKRATKQQKKQLDVLLSRIPDVVDLLAKNCTAFGGDTVVVDANEDDASVALTSSKVSLCALQALVALSSSSRNDEMLWGGGGGSENDQDESMDVTCATIATSSPVGRGIMNRMMEILLTAPPPLLPAKTTTAPTSEVTQRLHGQLAEMWRTRVNSAMALVSNLTRTEEGAIELVGRSLPDEAIAAVAVLTAGSTSTQYGKGEDHPNNSLEPNNSMGRLPNKPTMELLLARFLNTKYVVEVEDRHNSKGGGIGNNHIDDDPFLLRGDRDNALLSPPDESDLFSVSDSDDKQKDDDDEDTDDAPPIRPSSRRSRKTSSLQLMAAKDPFQHFASALMNVTQVEAGRLFVLKIRREHYHRSSSVQANNSQGCRSSSSTDKDAAINNSSNDNDGGWTVLQAILPQLKSSNLLRRRGVAGTIRNCCLDPDFAWWLLNVVKISSQVLYPLAGPEELTMEEKRGLDPNLWLEGPDKVREPDHLTRLYLVEAILFLASSGRQAQEVLRRERVSVVLKWAEMVEEQEDVSEKMAECLRLLQDNKNVERGMCEDERGENEGDDDDDSGPGGTALFGAPSAASQIEVHSNYDDVD